MVGSERLSNRLLNIYLPLAFYPGLPALPLLLDDHRLVQADERPLRHEVQPVLDPEVHAGELRVPVPGDRVRRVGEEHAHRVGGLDGPLARLQRLRRLRAGPPAVPGQQLPGRGDLPGLPGAADAPVPAAGAGDRQAGPLQHLLGADPHLSDAAHPLRLLAPHGVLPHDPQGDRGERHGGRLLAACRSSADDPAALRPRAALGGDLLLHPLLERVPLRPDLHVLRLA